MRPAFIIAFSATCLLVLAGMFLFPVFACACGHAPSSTCLSNVKQQALGNVMYAADNDNRFPRRDYWMDDIAPYVKNPAVFQDPELPKGSYGYAFNGALDRAKEPKDATKVPLLYDSENPIRNASDLVTSLPAGGRHPKKQPMGNMVAYADGHAKRVSAGKSP